MSYRTDLATYLEQQCPDYRVLPYSRQLTDAARLTVMLEPDQVAQAVGGYEATVSVHIVTGKTDPAAAEDELEAALFTVLEVLAKYPYSTWATAARAVYGEDPAQFHGYRISLPLPFYLSTEE